MPSERNARVVPLADAGSAEATSLELMLRPLRELLDDP